MIGDASPCYTRSSVAKSRRVKALRPTSVLDASAFFVAQECKLGHIPPPRVQIGRRQIGRPGRHCGRLLTLEFGAIFPAIGARRGGLSAPNRATNRLAWRCGVPRIRTLLQLPHFAARRFAPWKS